MSESLLPEEIAGPGELRPAQYQAWARTLCNRYDSSEVLRMALLSSHSFSFLEPFLIVECARRSLSVSPWSGPFGQIEQMILDPHAEFWAHSPDLVVIGLRVEDVYPDAFVRVNRADAVGLESQLNTCIDRLLECADRIRNRSAANILIANFALPHRDISLGPFDANSADGCTFTLANANRELASRAVAMAGLDVWDYAGLVSERGSWNWTDQRLWLLARQPISAANLPFAAEHLARTIVATTRPRAKCLVLDLDNTLWGGTAGDDGLQGIALSDDFPGSAFKSFQRAILGLRDAGILLAISSKNDEPNAREIIDSHPEMLLSWDDFVCTRINWEPKSSSLRQIAGEIGIGLDSLVFFDDNPVERAEVTLNAPEVRVIEVPGKPLQFQDALFGSGYFDTTVLTQEDSHRVKQYQEEAQRSAIGKGMTSMQDFLVSLEMQVTNGDVGDETIARAAQLISKTNQFNLTTRRHTQAALQQMVDSPDIDVRWTRLRDKFGDSGIVGITIVRHDEEIAIIDSFIMSCRVINRLVEFAMICDIEERCRHRGCSALMGEYITTAKNAMTADFFITQGFSEDSLTGHARWYRLNLSATQSLTWPDAIARN